MAELFKPPAADVGLEDSGGLQDDPGEDRAVDADADIGFSDDREAGPYDDRGADDIDPVP